MFLLYIFVCLLFENLLKMQIPGSIPVVKARNGLKFMNMDTEALPQYYGIYFMQIPVRRKKAYKGAGSKNNG